MLNIMEYKFLKNASFSQLYLRLKLLMRLVSYVADLEYTIMGTISISYFLNAFNTNHNNKVGPAL